MDVLSVSTVTGFGLGRMSREQMLRIATSFGGFPLLYAHTRVVSGVDDR